MPSKSRHVLASFRGSAGLLGKQDQARPERAAHVEKDLSERIGVARSTLQRIEKGDPVVEIGLVFEAATLSGVDLFVPEASTLAPQLSRIDDRLALMPGSIRGTRRTFDDEF